MSTSWKGYCPHPHIDDVVLRSESSHELLTLDEVIAKPDGLVDPFTISMEMRPSDSDLLLVQFVCRVSVAPDCRLLACRSSSRGV